MGDERRTQGERRRPAAVSVRRLEGKVDRVVERLDAMHLNGDITALREMAQFWRQSGPQLKALVGVAPSIIAAVQRDNDLAAFWRVTRRILNPLRPAGALAWTVIGTIAAALIWDFFTRPR